MLCSIKINHTYSKIPLTKPHGGTFNGSCLNSGTLNGSILNLNLTKDIF